MKFLILSIAFLLSCSATPTKTDAPIEGATSTPVEGATSTPVATKISFSISKDGVTGLKVKDGDIFIGEALIGKMVGSTMVAPDQSVVATIENGHVLDKNGKTLVMLDEAGNLDNGSGMLLSWSPDGHFMKGSEDSGFVLEPNDPKLYHSASLILFLYLSSSKVESTKPIETTPEVITN